MKIKTLTALAFLTPALLCNVAADAWARSDFGRASAAEAALIYNEAVLIYNEARLDHSEVWAGAYFLAYFKTKVQGDRRSGADVDAYTKNYAYFYAKSKDEGLSDADADNRAYFNVYEYAQRDPYAYYYAKSKLDGHSNAEADAHAKADAMIYDPAYAAAYAVDQRDFVDANAEADAHIDAETRANIAAHAYAKVHFKDYIKDTGTGDAR